MDKRNIRRFKRSFWGKDPAIQIVGEKGQVHKIKSLRTKTARFLESCDVTIQGIPVEFNEAIFLLSNGQTQSASTYNINDGRPHYDGCYRRLTSDNPNELCQDKVPALNALYTAYEGVRHRKWIQSLQNSSH